MVEHRRGRLRGGHQRRPHDSVKQRRRRRQRLHPGSPYCSDCKSGRESVGGTSFATPRSAGTACAVLLEARRAAGHVGGPDVREGTGSLTVSGNGLELTPFRLRRAFEEAAHDPGVSDYDPVEAVFDLGATPVVDAAP